MPDGTRHAGLDETVRLPAVANAWPYPIENRINMLATGIKTDIGIKVFGPDAKVLNDLGERIANAVRPIPGTVSAYPDRTLGGFYLDIDINTAEAARFAMTKGDVQDVIQTAIGGMNVTTVMDGLARLSPECAVPLGNARRYSAAQGDCWSRRPAECRFRWDRWRISGYRRGRR